VLTDDLEPDLTEPLDDLLELSSALPAVIENPAEALPDLTDLTTDLDALGEYARDNIDVSSYFEALSEAIAITGLSLNQYFEQAMPELQIQLDAGYEPLLFQQNRVPGVYIPSIDETNPHPEGTFGTSRI